MSAKSIEFDERDIATAMVNYALLKHPGHMDYTQVRFEATFTNGTISGRLIEGHAGDKEPVIVPIAPIDPPPASP